jgi:hypothetical protein
MTRFTLLSLALASIPACTVGNIPDSDEPPAGVVCDKKAQAVDGNHFEGMSCATAGACHPITDGGAGAGPFLQLAGTVYAKSDGAEPTEGATVTLTWNGGSKKFVTGTAPGKGNFFDYTVTGITFPATVKVSLCPDPELAMNTPLANAGDLNCSKGGCHNQSLRIFIKQ